MNKSQNTEWQLRIYYGTKLNIAYYQELDFFSKLWKKSDEYGFLKLSPAQTLQQTLKQLEPASKDAFDEYEKRSRRDIA